MDFYSSLFELMKENLNQSGQHMECSADSFSASTCIDPVYIDLTGAESLKGREYLNAVWLALFQKLPSQDVVSVYASKCNADILQKAVNEPAFAIRRMKICNGIHPIKTGMKSQIYATTACIKNSVFLRKIAKKMPKEIQNKIRGIYS